MPPKNMDALQQKHDARVQLQEARDAKAAEHRERTRKRENDEKQRRLEQSRQKPRIKKLQRMALSQPRAPKTFSAIELFKSMDDNTIVFFVNGYKIGEFQLTRHDDENVELTCYSKTFDAAKHDADATGSCIQINISPSDVALDDYFYYAKENNYQCEMKPTSMEQHKRILKTLLEFLAYAFQISSITLQDAASRKYTHCPPLWTGIHLVAGLGSFYGKAAGFKNSTADRIAKDVGEMPVPKVIRALDVPARYGVYSRLKDVANHIIQVCKTERETISWEDIAMIKYIQQSFREKYSFAKGTHILDYYKKVTGMYGCRVKHADDMVDEKLVDPVNLEPGEPIKKFLYMDIITS